MTPNEALAKAQEHVERYPLSHDNDARVPFHAILNLIGDRITEEEKNRIIGWLGNIEHAGWSEGVDRMYKRMAKVGA